MADTAVVKNKTKKVKSGPSLNAHLKSQNIFFYLSAISSVALIVMLFLPWAKTSSVLDLLLRSMKDYDLAFFMFPVTLLFFAFHVVYLISLFRPGHDVMFKGTAIMLLVGIELLLVLFAGDVTYSIFTSGTISDFTLVPLIWLVLSLVQKGIFVKLAHKKKTV